MRSSRRLLLVILFLLALFLLFEFSGIRGQFSLQMLQELILMHPVAGLLLFVLLFALGNLIQIPGWLFLAAAVLALGRLYGGLATYLAACASCVFTFFTIRYLGGNALHELDNRLAQRLLAGLHRRPLASIVTLRILFQTVPALNYSLALSGVRFRHYLLGTLLGLPLPIALYCLFFDYLATWLNIAPLASNASL
ncbi:VTT domain-containing protein [Pseudomonas lalucatii]|uniref:TVP38/TMEM64 family membrane protein n=1 Tax=Pseudomonas lalucatii TaxID=1424203 RepID=A0ABS5Q4Q5_9PSED|nr:VTT domain-containing protein [Pseudomonas lalucatii]MBS7663682.1 VTT domain-containing protein [Pseudomonas lalucatii]MBS7689733.1 VTT domain-containing protein [Pseudomonas lalucatii]MBS7725161.1 VTT domain-containing protein [Pseudomonas lalucatii]QVM86878.1 VTT domain-containing protein [Pseudomonas lalucatii]